MNSSSKNTPLQELNEALAKSEIKYRNLVETSNDLIWSVDAEGRWTFLNRKATLQIYGYEPEEMLGRHFTEFEPPEQIPKDLETFQQVKSGIPFFKYESTHIRKDGQAVHLLFNAIVSRDAQGNVIGATGTAADITEQKKAELLLEKKSKQLLEHQNALLLLSKMDFSDFQKSLRSILKTSSELLKIERVSFWSYNNEHNQIICQNLYNKSLDEYQSGNYLRAQDYPRYFKALEDNLLIASNDARKDLRTSEFEQSYLIPLDIYSMMDVPVRLHGKIVGVLCHEHVGSPRKWSEEEQDFATSAAGMISMGLLISQLQETKKELQKKTEDLKQSNKSLEEFAYTASHDLQEPLYIITAFLDKIREKHETELKSETLFLIDRIYNAALRMTHLTQDLLNYARINTRKKPFEKVDLNTLLKQILIDFELRIKETQAEITLGNLPSLYADPLQMSQLFSNLLSNALKFKNENKILKVRLDSKKTNEKNIEIIIEDNGIGFEKEYQEKIFQPFQRLHPKNEYEGSGMGLAICKKIVERHQGSIQAFSTPNEGTKLIIQLPTLQEPI